MKKVDRSVKAFLWIIGLGAALLSVGWVYFFNFSEGLSKQRSTYRQSFDYAPLVRVEIAGKQYNFMLDSGASVVVLDTQLARKITGAMDTSKLFEKSVYRGFATTEGTLGEVDSSRIEFVRPVDLKMGPFSLGGQDVWMATDLSALSETVGVHISGLLGVDTFRQFTWQVFNDLKVMEFSRGPIEADSFDECVSYSDEYGYHPGLKIGVGNYTVFMPFDTGAKTSYVAKELIDHLSAEPGGLQSRSSLELSVTLGGLSETSRYVLNSVTLDGKALGAFEVSEVPESYGLGLDMLSRFDRYAFIPSRRMFCYSGRKPIDSLPPTYRDVRIKSNDGKIVVDYNSSEMLKVLGLANGDVILAVNGHVYFGNQIHVVRELLKTTPTGKLKLQILRGRKKIEVGL
ncbi:aspartyl protease family protein [Pseudomonas mosselii]|uniref:aspartyl protease family protein n=1 Tax=Pseudomonas mosselii TaxID=78327 RepID=UPI002DB67A17|nr:aspartyl protease family protein [Pseudomonas mosselii]MEB5932398.1 aspartyl protease family protein [Pseudomonas mosselii]